MNVASARLDVGGQIAWVSTPTSGSQGEGQTRPGIDGHSSILQGSDHQLDGILVMLLHRGMNQQGAAEVAPQFFIAEGGCLVQKVSDSIAGDGNRGDDRAEGFVGKTVLCLVIGGNVWNPEASDSR